MAQSCQGVGFGGLRGLSPHQALCRGYASSQSLPESKQLKQCFYRFGILVNLTSLQCYLLFLSFFFLLVTSEIEHLFLQKYFLIDLREKGSRKRKRETDREREREINLLFHLLMHSLAASCTRPDRDQTCNLGASGRCSTQVSTQPGLSIFLYVLIVPVFSSLKCLLFTPFVPIFLLLFSYTLNSSLYSGIFIQFYFQKSTLRGKSFCTFIPKII